MAVVNRAHSTTSYMVHTRLSDVNRFLLVGEQVVPEAVGSLLGVFGIRSVCVAAGSPLPGASRGSYEQNVIFFNKIGQLEERPTRGRPN